MRPRDPLTAFLGFDPREVDVDEPAPAVEVRAAIVARPPPAAPPASGAAVTLDQAIDADPRGVLLRVLKVIWRNVQPNARGVMPVGGRFGQVKAASCWALRELAADPEFRDQIQGSGWIVGKRDDPHK